MSTSMLSLSTQLGNAVDPSSSRLNTLNLTSFQKSSPSVTLSGAELNDKRVRISMLPNSPAIFYKDKLGNALLYNYLGATNGVLFPFQPKVDISFSANYQTQKVTQSNFTFYNYENSELKPFELTCDFPARNISEGQYVIAAITFLRSLTMMFTGMDNSIANNGYNLAGSPPLVVSLQGMGFGGLDYIPIVITNITTSYPDNVDYITIKMTQAANLSSEIIKIPTLTTISVSCLPMFSRTFASQFSALDFSSGARRLLGPNGFTSSSNISSYEVSTTVTANDTSSSIDTTSQIIDTVISTG
jgi:hypothetical protein